jgi:hypothetical protein
VSTKILLDRDARAKRLRDYFELQLRFAALLAERTDRPFTEAVRHFTNFHLRFNFGDPDAGLAPGWGDYTRRLSDLHDLDARLAWTQEFFISTPEQPPSPGRPLFGSFRYDTPDEHGVIRIHFGNRDDDGASPLGRGKTDRRTADLAAMFADIAKHHPEAKTVRGNSWLYHLEAYRRLFPPAYGASARPAIRARLSGTSSWGQFLKHDERINAERRDAFLANFAQIDPATPWFSFPLPVLTAEAPLAAFTDFYLDRHPGIHD